MVQLDCQPMIAQNCPKLPKIAQNYPKLPKKFKTHQKVHFLITHSTVLVTRKFWGAVSFRLYHYNKQRWYDCTFSQGLPKIAPKLPKIVKDCQRLPKIPEKCQKLPNCHKKVQWCSKLSLILYHWTFIQKLLKMPLNSSKLPKITPIYPKFPKITQNNPKLSKFVKNVHFLVTQSTVTIKLQCSKLSFI